MAAATVKSPFAAAWWGEKRGSLRGREASWVYGVSLILIRSALWRDGGEVEASVWRRSIRVASSRRRRS
jgi:hypothetical protein